MDIDDICITFLKSNNKFDDKIDFFKTNFNKIFDYVRSTVITRTTLIG